MHLGSEFNLWVVLGFSVRTKFGFFFLKFFYFRTECKPISYHKGDEICMTPYSFFQRFQSTKFSVEILN